MRRDLPGTMIDLMPGWSDLEGGPIERRPPGSGERIALSNVKLLALGSKDRGQDRSPLASIMPTILPRARMETDGHRIKFWFYKGVTSNQWPVR